MWPPWPDCTTDGANRDEVEGEKRSIITAKLFEGAVATRGAVNAYEGRKRRTQRLERWRGPRKASKTPTEVKVNDDTEDLIRPATRVFGQTESPEQLCRSKRSGTLNLILLNTQMTEE